jgi:hypothetical protein
MYGIDLGWAVSTQTDMRGCAGRRATMPLLSSFKPFFGGFAMAETTKLSVRKALEKLRDTEVPKSRMTRLNEKTDELKEEVRRLRAARHRLERDQQAGSTKPR